MVDVLGCTRMLDGESERSGWLVQGHLRALSFAHRLIVLVPLQRAHHSDINDARSRNWWRRQVPSAEKSSADRGDRGDT